MKLRNVNTHISSNLEQAPQDFRIKTSAKAFQILSSQLYTDKIGAVVRELSTNAYDAHKLVNKADTSFEVHLPISLTPEFYVRDYGPGLTHKQIMTLYTTYFDSDKLHTNELAGGLGLGSKTPFAYTDTFSVSSFQNGIVRLYSAFIKDGFPQIVPLSTSATDEPNGLKVSLPIKSQDFEDFYDACQKQLRYFNPKPNITGQECKLKEVEYVLQEKKFALRGYTGYYNLENRIVMGPVAYPIDRNNAPDSIKTKLDQLGFKNIDIFAEVGDVDIAASREGLSYDEFSTKRVLKFLDTIDEIIKAKVEARIAKAKSLWDAYRIANAFKENTKLKNLTWRKKIINNKYITLKTNYMVAKPTYDDWQKKNLRLHFAYEIDIDTSGPKPTIVYQDNPHIPLYSTLRLNEQELRKHGLLYVVKFGADLAKLCETTQVFNWIDMSSLELPQSPVRRTARKAKIGLAKVQLANNWNSWDHTTEINVSEFIADSAVPVTWVGRNGNNNLNKKFTITSMRTDASFLDWFGNLKCVILGIPRSSKYIEKKLTIPHFEDWFLAQINQYYPNYDLKLIAEFDRLVDSNENEWYIMQSLIKDKDWSKYFLTRDKNFAKICNLYQSEPNSSFAIKFRFLRIYEKYSGKSIKPKRYGIEPAFNRFKKRFELLFTLPFDSYSTYKIEHLRPYLDKVR